MRLLVIMKLKDSREASIALWVGSVARSTRDQEQRK